MGRYRHACSHCSNGCCRTFTRGSSETMSCMPSKRQNMTSRSCGSWKMTMEPGSAPEWQALLQFLYTGVFVHSNLI